MRRKPHELQWLEVLKQRITLDSYKYDSYKKLQQGFIGESSFDQLASTFLGEKFEYLDDITLEYQANKTQIDKLIIAGKTACLIDMKYYQGEYQYKNNEWYLGEKVLTHNNFEQLRRARRVLQNVFQAHQINLEVHGVLAFMNPESSLKIVDKVNETVLNYTDVPLWLMQLSQVQTNSQSLNWKKAIQNYEIPPHRTTNIFPIGDINSLKRGICCPHCHQFQMVETRHTMDCICGYIEAKERAFSRTICEYGVIFHNYNLEIASLRAFFGKNLNDRYLEYILQKHFVHVQNKGRKAGYVNKGILFEYWFEEKMAYFESLSVRKNWLRSNYIK